MLEIPIMDFMLEHDSETIREELKREYKRSSFRSIRQLALAADVNYHTLNDFIGKVPRTQMIKGDSLDKVRAALARDRGEVETATINTTDIVSQLADSAVETHVRAAHIDAQLMQGSIAKVHQAIEGMEPKPTSEQIAGAAWLVYCESEKFEEPPSLSMASMAIKLFLKGDGNGRELENKSRE